MAALQELTLPACRIGDVPVYQLTSTYQTTGAAWNPSSATAVWLDPERQIPSGGSGTATGGSTTTLTTTNAEVIALANDAVNGLSILVTDATDGKEHRARITDFAVAAGVATITFGAQAITVASGDTFVIEGYPLIALAAVTPSTNTIPLTGTSAVTTYEGRRQVLVVVTYSGSGPWTQVCSFDVLPAT